MPEAEIQIGDTSAGRSYGQIVWRQFRKKPYALAALAVIGLLFVACVFAPFLANNKPYVMTVDGKTTYPLFEYLSGYDYLLLSGFAWFWAGFITWRVLLGRQRWRTQAWKLGMLVAVAGFGVTAIGLLELASFRLHGRLGASLAALIGDWYYRGAFLASCLAAYVLARLLSSAQRPVRVLEGIIIAVAVSSWVLGFVWLLFMRPADYAAKHAWWTVVVRGAVGCALAGSILIAVRIATGKRRLPIFLWICTFSAVLSVLSVGTFAAGWFCGAPPPADGMAGYSVVAFAVCLLLALSVGRAAAKHSESKKVPPAAAALTWLACFGVLLCVPRLAGIQRIEREPEYYRQIAALPGASAVFAPIRFRHDEQLLDIPLKAPSDLLTFEQVLADKHKAIDEELKVELGFAQVNIADPEAFAQRKALLERRAEKRRAAAVPAARKEVARANAELPLHFLGTDASGRDVASRMLWATRTSLAVGFVAVAIAAVIGCSLGAVAGYIGGKTDVTVMRIVEIVICFPAFFLMLTIIAFWGRGLDKIMISFGLIGWTGYARFVRAEFLRLRELDFAASAEALGLGRARIMFRHLLPNAMTPVLITATFGIARAVLAEAGISFLGFGDVSAPSWGDLLMQARDHFSPMLAWPSTVAILVTVLSYNLIGDSLRDALDPKLRV
jgi:peptide/nickel transport system permease protein